MALRVLDGRVRDTVSLPRFRVEEGLVDIQAASVEASQWINSASLLTENASVLKCLTNADTLVRYSEHTAHDLAGEVRDCPDGLTGPDGHAA